MLKYGYGEHEPGPVRSHDEEAIHKILLTDEIRIKLKEFQEALEGGSLASTDRILSEIEELLRQIEREADSYQISHAEHFREFAPQSDVPYRLFEGGPGK